MTAPRPRHVPTAIAAALLAAAAVSADTESVPDDVVAGQRAALAAETDGVGFGPQSPRDIDGPEGRNRLTFSEAPPHDAMNLCNIHFHESAEHKGRNFSRYAGNGDGRGAGTGFLYSGELTEAELAPIDAPIGAGDYGSLEPGDTIEVHYVHTSAAISPGPTLSACLSDATQNPQLRVEAQVYVLVNDSSARDFGEIAAVERVDGLHQVPNLPSDLGTPVRYTGSTTGPGYNEKGSPLQVSWSVHPEVAKVDIATVGAWLEDNAFDETAAHGVRNLVTNPALLSPME